jgi:RNA polymerase primary sigma factor
VPRGKRINERHVGGPLAPAMERRLVDAAQHGDAAAREDLVEAFLPLIGGIARHYRTAPGVGRDELMQDGVVGLLRALERFDLVRGTPFWAYASWWVRQAMQDLVSELTHPVVLSDRALRQLAHVKRARAAHLQAHGREPRPSDLVEATGLSRESLEALAAVERRPRGLGEPVRPGDDGSCTLGDRVADAGAEDAYEDAARRLASEELRACRPQLDSREDDVLHARFGFGGPEQTLQEVGEQLGVSAERVRQIEQGALEKLRAAANEPARRRGRRRVLVPALDVCASSDERLLRVDVPGVRRDALRVTLKGGLLIIRGSRRAPPPAPGWTRERRFGTFQRVVRVPVGLDLRAIRIHLADGVLTVRFPAHPGREPSVS